MEAVARALSAYVVHSRPIPQPHGWWPPTRGFAGARSVGMKTAWLWLKGVRRELGAPDVSGLDMGSHRPSHHGLALENAP